MAKVPDEQLSTSWSLTAIGVGFVVAIACSGIGASLVVAAGASENSPAALLGGLVPFWAVLVATVVVVRGHGLGSLRLLSVWSDALVGLPTGAVTQLLVPLVYLPAWLLHADLDLDKPARELLDRGSGASLALLVIAVVLIAPVIEEMFFRGLLLQAMQERWSTRAAVVGSSAVFGATHFQPLQFPPLALAGAVFALLALRAGRLGPAVWAHAGFNTVTVLWLVAWR